MACSCRLHELTSVAFLCCNSAAMPHGASPSDTDGGLWQVRRLGLRRETEAAVRAAELPKTPGNSSSGRECRMNHSDRINCSKRTTSTAAGRN
jgi:hypothetical protein